MDASNMELLDRTGWETLSASSEEPKEGDWGHSGLKEACLDGDLNTFWVPTGVLSIRNHLTGLLLT